MGLSGTILTSQGLQAIIINPYRAELVSSFILARSQEWQWLWLMSYLGETEPLEHLGGQRSTSQC